MRKKYKDDYERCEAINMYWAERGRVAGAYPVVKKYQMAFDGRREEGKSTIIKFNHDGKGYPPKVEA